MFCPENINPEIIETLRTIPTYAVAKRLVITELHCFSACKRAGIFEIYTQEYVDELTAFITMRFGNATRTQDIWIISGEVNDPPGLSPPNGCV